MAPSNFEAASSMAGVSPAYQRLEYLIAKCCDLAKVLPPASLSRIDPIRETEDEEEDKKEDEEDKLTTDEQLLAVYSNLPPCERQPEELPESIKSRLAQYCAQSRYPVEIIIQAFENWVALSEGIVEFKELIGVCDARKAASFTQLADQVYQTLGFRDEERKVGLVAARREVMAARQRLPQITLREAWGLSSPIFSDVEEILVHLISFYCRALDGMGRDYRQTVLELLKQSGSSSFGNYRSEKMQFGNKIDVLMRVDQHIKDRLLVEFQNKFGQSREGIIDQVKWEPVLRRLSIIRGATAHSDTVVDDIDLEEIKSILTSIERQHFTDERLEFHFNERQERVVKFNPLHIRTLVKHALDWLDELYEYLAEGIFPQIQFQDRIEIGRDGRAFLIYTDEEGRAVPSDLGQKRNFEGIFFPGQYVFFTFFHNNVPFWLPVRERTR